MTAHPDLDRDDALRRMLVGTVGASAPRALSRRARQQAVGLVAAGLLVGVLAGGTVTASVLTGGTVPVAAPVLPTPTATSGSEAFTATTGDSPQLPGPAAADYDLAGSPAELATMMPVVLRGVVDEVSEVPTATATAAGRLVLVLRGVTVAQGSVTRQADGTVGVNIPLDIEDGLDRGDFEVLFPEGMDVVAYVRPAGEPAEGRTTGYQVGTPQTLIVQRPGSGVVEWPMLGETRPGSIADTLPDGNLIGGAGS